MRILFLHKGFPGQFRNLVVYLLRRGDIIHYIGPKKVNLKTIRNFESIQYKIERGNTNDIHPLAVETETKVLRGEAVAKEAFSLKKTGYEPDLIIGHPGWGEMLFMSDVWPNVKQLHYVEYCYGAPDTDTDFVKENQTNIKWFTKAKERMKNANTLLNLEQMTWGITPTKFQHSTIPEWGKNKTDVIHDGIDTNWASPKENVSVRIREDKVITSKSKIVTFVNRTYEPYRGIDKFVEAIMYLQKKDPDTCVLLVGKDTPKVSYGRQREDGKGWLSALKQEYEDRINWENIYNLGVVKHEVLRDLFRITTVHVYLTYPFVLSWSLLEAMSCGALIGSKTRPVEEVIKNEENGLLVDFNDPKELANKISIVLNNSDKYNDIRKKARKL